LPRSGRLTPSSIGRDRRPPQYLARTAPLQYPGSHYLYESWEHFALFVEGAGSIGVAGFWDDPYCDISTLPFRKRTQEWRPVHANPNMLVFFRNSFKTAICGWSRASKGCHFRPTASHYRIIEKPGGGIGIVYKPCDTHFDRCDDRS